MGKLHYVTAAQEPIEGCYKHEFQFKTDKASGYKWLHFGQSHPSADKVFMCGKSQIAELIFKVGYLLSKPILFLINKSLYMVNI